MTSRGMKESEMKQIGEWISAIIQDSGNAALQERIKEEVRSLASNYTLYPDLT